MDIRWSYSTLISFKFYPIQITWVQHDVIAMYFDSTVDRETKGYFLLNHETRMFPKRNALPLVLFLSSKLPAQSTYVYDFKVKCSPLWYHRPKSNVPFKYLNILFTACTYVSLGASWNLATIPTTYIISGLEVVI